MLARVADHLGTDLRHVTLEPIWTCIDYHAKFQPAFRPDWVPRGKVVAELKSAILRLCGSKCDEVAERLALQRPRRLGLFHDNTFTLSRIVHQITPGDTLISFNYDTLVERLVLKRKGLSLRHSCASAANGIVRFAKPHGSASWNLHRLSSDVLDGPPLLESLCAVQAKEHPDKFDPLVLGAVPIKSELIREVQQHFGTEALFEVILQQWRAVVDAIRDAERIVVLGYSFPKEDTYGRFFFREAMRDRGRRRLRVDFYQKRKYSKETACSIKDAFPGVSKSDIHFNGEVTPAP